MDRVVRRGEDGALDAVLELAHVARPLPREQHVHGGRGDLRDLLAVLHAHALHEVLGEQQHVARARGEVGHRDREHGKAVVEVLAELALGHHALEVAARRGDEAHVGADLHVRPDAREGALLQEPEQLHLERHAQVADLVEEQRAAVRRLRAADAPLVGARERAFLMTEQLALDQRLRQGRAVEGHERPVLPGGQPLDRARDKFLARAARAAHEHRRVARRHLADLLVHGAHLAAVAEQVAGVRGEHVAQTAVLRHERVALLALLQAHRRRLGGDVRDDLQQRHVPVEGFRREIRRVGAVHGQRADHLPEVDQRHAHERDGTRPATRARPVEETAVRMHVRHHLRAPRLRHASRDALAQTVVPVRLLLRVQSARRLN